MFNSRFPRLVPALILAVIFSAPGLAAGEPGTRESATPPLSMQDLIYLKELLRARLDLADLADDERRIIVKIRKRLDGIRPALIPKAERPDIEERLLEILREMVALNPDRRNSRMDLARYYLYRDDPERALLHLERAGAGSERDVFWPLLMTYAYLRLGEHRRAEPHLKSAEDAIRVLLPLRLQHVLFCDRVRGMGQYKPRDSQSLSPGEATWIYFEVVGGEFKKAADKSYRPSFTLGVTIRDELQRTVWKKRPYVRFDRFDYQHPVEAVFGGTDFVIPAELKPGKHTLILHVEDNYSGKTATADIEFTVAGERAGE